MKLYTRGFRLWEAHGIIRTDKVKFEMQNAECKMQNCGVRDADKL